MIKTDDPTFMRLFKTQFKLKNSEKQEKIEKKRTDETDERIIKLYNDEFKKKDKMKELAKKFEIVENNELDCLVYSNRLILTKFKQQFSQEVANLEKNNENGPITKLTLTQFCIIIKFNF